MGIMTEREDDFGEDVVFDTGGQISIKRKIASGGMGTVYKATLGNIEGFEKIVALKTLNPDLCSDSKCVKYFINEAKLASHLCHENIVQLYNLGKFKNSYYMVYEYIHGTTLHEFISYHRLLTNPIPEEYALFIVSRIARGLAYAHSLLDSNKENCQIVHRDICPKNIMITTEGEPKLTDFGIAITRTEMPDDTLSGKPLYMSPEQAGKGNIDFRSDIYSLGTVLFYMLTGSLTRDIVGGLHNLLVQAINGDVDWSKFPCDDNLQLFEILQKMMALNADDRYLDTHDLVTDLEQYMYYKGYRTTIGTLANYLNREMPYIFSNDTSHLKPLAHSETLVDEDIDLEEDDSHFGCEDETVYTDLETILA